MRWRIIWCEPIHVFHTVSETRLLANQSSRLQNVILYYVMLHGTIFNAALSREKLMRAV